MDAYLTNKDMGFLFTWMWGIGLIHSIGVNKVEGCCGQIPSVSCTLLLLAKVGYNNSPTVIHLDWP